MCFFNTSTYNWFSTKVLSILKRMEFGKVTVAAILFYTKITMQLPIYWLTSNLFHYQTSTFPCRDKSLHPQSRRTKAIIGHLDYKLARWYPCPPTLHFPGKHWNFNFRLIKEPWVYCCILLLPMYLFTGQKCTCLQTANTAWFGGARPSACTHSCSQSFHTTLHKQGALFSCQLESIRLLKCFFQVFLRCWDFQWL